MGLNAEKVMIEMVEDNTSVNQSAIPYTCIDLHSQCTEFSLMIIMMLPPSLLHLPSLFLSIDSSSQGNCVQDGGVGD